MNGTAIFRQMYIFFSTSRAHYKSHTHPLSVCFTNSFIPVPFTDKHAASPQLHTPTCCIFPSLHSHRVLPFAMVSLFYILLLLFCFRSKNISSITFLFGSQWAASYLTVIFWRLFHFPYFHAVLHVARAFLTAAPK